MTSTQTSGNMAQSGHTQAKSATSGDKFPTFMDLFLSSIWDINDHKRFKRIVRERDQAIAEGRTPPLEIFKTSDGIKAQKKREKEGGLGGAGA